MPAPAFLKARQTKYAAYATMYIVVVFAIIYLVFLRRA